MSCDDQYFTFWIKGKHIKMATIAEVKKMSPVDLFGLVGGYLGLFVGVSVITFIEFLEYGLTRFGRFFREKLDPTKVTSPEEVTG